MKTQPQSNFGSFNQIRNKQRRDNGDFLSVAIAVAVAGLSWKGKRRLFRDTLEANFNLNEITLIGEINKDLGSKKRHIYTKAVLRLRRQMRCAAAKYGFVFLARTNGEYEVLRPSQEWRDKYSYDNYKSIRYFGTKVLSERYMKEGGITHEDKDAKTAQASRV